MPFPLVAALVVAAAATQAVSTVAQIQTSKANEAAIRDQQAVRAEEIRQAATADLFDRARASRRERSRIETAAAGAGLNVGSPTIETLLLDSLTQQQLASERTITNNNIQQRSNTTTAAQALANTSRPTLLGAAVQIGGSAYKAYAGAKGK